MGFVDSDRDDAVLALARRSKALWIVRRWIVQRQAPLPNRAPPISANGMICSNTWINSDVNPLRRARRRAAGRHARRPLPQGRGRGQPGRSARAVEVDDRLEIGSNTKSFTVTLALQLQEAGVLSMDDPLSKWLPELAAQIPNGDQVDPAPDGRQHLRHLGLRRPVDAAAD